MAKCPTAKSPTAKSPVTATIALCGGAERVGPATSGNIVCGKTHYATISFTFHSSYIPRAFYLNLCLHRGVMPRPPTTPFLVIQMSY